MNLQENGIKPGKYKFNRPLDFPTFLTVVYKTHRGYYIIWDREDASLIHIGLYTYFEQWEEYLIPV